MTDERETCTGTDAKPELTREVRHIYYPIRTGDGKRTGETWVVTLHACEASECVMCGGMNQFLSDVQTHANVPRWVGQCRANLRKHLATGKHWKQVGDGHYIKSRSRKE